MRELKYIENDLYVARMIKSKLVPMYEQCLIYARFGSEDYIIAEKKRLTENIKILVKRRKENKNLPIDLRIKDLYKLELKEYRKQLKWIKYLLNERSIWPGTGKTKNSSESSVHKKEIGTN